MTGTPEDFAHLLPLGPTDEQRDRARARFVDGIGRARTRLRIQAAEAGTLHTIEGPSDDWPGERWGLTLIEEAELTAAELRSLGLDYGYAQASNTAKGRIAARGGAL